MAEFNYLTQTCEFFALPLQNNVNLRTIVLILSGLESILQNFFFYFTSTKPLLIIYRISTI